MQQIQQETKENYWIVFLVDLDPRRRDVSEDFSFLYTTIILLYTSFPQIIFTNTEVKK